MSHVDILPAIRLEAVVILMTRSAMAERMRTFRIHSTLPRQSIRLFAQAARR
jgi:hypothetical protein